MNVVVTQTAINASVSDLNVSASVTSTPISVTVSSGLLDAPSNGLTYGRNNGAWVSITGTGGGSSLPVADTQTIVMGSVDPTKLLRFEVDGFTAGATRILTPPNQDTLLAGQNFLNIFTVDQVVDAHMAAGNDAVLNYNPFVDSARVSLSVVETFTSAFSAGFHENQGISVGLTANPSANASRTDYRGLAFNVQSQSGNTQPMRGMMGMYGLAYHNADGDMTYLYGSAAFVSNSGAADLGEEIGNYIYIDHYGTGVVSDFYGQNFEIWIGSTIGNLYGQHIGINDDGGSATNAYGIKIEDVSVGATNYAVYTGVGDVSFGDNLFLRVIKSGATQVGAGAAAGEVWKTNGHATLPNNVLMIGV